MPVSWPPLTSATAVACTPLAGGAMVTEGAEKYPAPGVVTDTPETTPPVMADVATACTTKAGGEPMLTAGAPE